MNYKPLIADKTEEFFEVLPDYTIGDMLYSTIVELSKGRQTLTKSSLRKINDEMYYQALCRALNKERENG